MVYRRHAPPTHVAILKIPASELMTRSALIAPAPAEPEYRSIHRDARRLGKEAGPLRSTVRPYTATTPALRPAHKVRAVRGNAAGRHGHENGRPGDVEGSAMWLAGRRTDLASWNWSLRPIRNSIAPTRERTVSA